MLYFIRQEENLIMALKSLLSLGESPPFQGVGQTVTMTSGPAT